MKLVQVLLFVFLLAVGGQTMAQPGANALVVGKVAFVVGVAYAQTGTGAKVKLQQGNAIFVGQTLSTNNTSHLHLSMMDGGFISLRPDAEVQVKRYNIDLAQPANTQIQLDVHKGVVRSVTGKGGQSNKSGFRLNTPVAAIGIRGTDFTVYTDNLSSSVSIRQGGVVVSPFSAWCSRSALGACNGDQAVVLAATTNQSLLAEVHAAQEQATLVNKTDTQLVPDEMQPAHPVEDKSAQDTKIVPLVGVNGSAVDTQQNTAQTDTKENNTDEQHDGSQTTDETETDKTAATDDTNAGEKATDNGKNSASDNATSERSTTADNSSSTSTTTTDVGTDAGTATQKNTDTSSSTTTASATSTTATTTSTSSTAEVASLTPVTGEVGAKDSVTSELASQVIAQATAAESVKSISDATDQTSSTSSTTPPVDSNPSTKPQVFYSKDKSTPATSSEQVVAQNGEYWVGSNESNAPNLPKTGSLSFALDKSVAAVRVGDTLKTAQVVDPTLAVNFDNNSFTTQLTVKSDALAGGSANLNAAGSVTGSNFASNADASNMVVAGALSNDGRQAGYVFDQAATGIVGATTWQAQ